MVSQKVSENVAAAYREGAQAFVLKPSSFKQFVQELSDILKQYRIEFQKALFTANENIKSSDSCCSRSI